MKYSKSVIITILILIICILCFFLILNNTKQKTEAVNDKNENQITAIEEAITSDSTNDEENLTQESTTTENLEKESTNKIVIPDNLPDNNFYEKWAIDLKNSNATIYNMDKTDCVETEAQYIYNGDLLSTLISNQELRNDLNIQPNWLGLSIYTSEYLKQLEYKAAHFTHTNYNTNFYAYHVCHLGNNLDITSGYLYPDAKNQASNRHVLLIKEDSVIELKDIDTNGKSASVDTCHSNLIDEKIEWECDQSSKADYYIKWIIDLNGKVLDKKQNFIETEDGHMQLK